MKSTTSLPRTPLSKNKPSMGIKKAPKAKNTLARLPLKQYSKDPKNGKPFQLGV
jgi:hypothetical protein